MKQTISDMPPVMIPMMLMTLCSVLPRLRPRKPNRRASGPSTQAIIPTIGIQAVKIPNKPVTSPVLSWRADLTGC
jgi:hypothetical protein